MNMIRHHDSNTEIEFLPIVMKTTVQDNSSSTLRKNPPMLRAESHKMLLVVALKMRKPSTIKSLRHKQECRDSRPRLSAERSSALPKSSGDSQAAGFGSDTKFLPDFSSGMLKRKPRRAIARPDSRGRLSLQNEWQLPSNHRDPQLPTNPHAQP